MRDSRHKRSWRDWFVAAVWRLLQGYYGNWLCWPLKGMHLNKIKHIVWIVLSAGPWIREPCNTMRTLLPWQIRISIDFGRRWIQASQRTSGVAMLNDTLMWQSDFTRRHHVDCLAAIKLLAARAQNRDPPTSLSSIAPHLAYLAHDSFSLKSLLKHEVLLPRLIWIHIDIHILFRYNPTIYLSSITALLLAIKNGAVSKSDKIHRSYIEKQASSGSLSIYSSVGWILRALAILTVRDGVRLRHKYLVPVQIGRRSE